MNRFFIFLSFIILVSCSDNLDSNLSEDYKIFSVVIDYVMENSKHNSILVMDSTIIVTSEESGFGYLKPDGSWFYEDNKLNFNYKYKNFQKWLNNEWEASHLDSSLKINNLNRIKIYIGKFNTDYSLREINNAKLEQSCSNGKYFDWKVFRQKYPNHKGFISFSRVGYNKAKNQAVVYLEILSGDTGGHGEYTLLKYEDKHWSVKDRIYTWES